MQKKDILINSDILSKMSIEEKIELCCGADFWHTKAFEKYGVEQTTVADGPHGVRHQAENADMLGIHASVPATCFPTAAATGCSWDKELITEVGRAIAEEALSLGVDTVLGPGLNIKRNPLCGRNFEYFSEDPYLTGQLGAAFINGVQENGIGACAKHFAANSQEYKRFSSNDHIDERTLREIYLPAFEQAVKEGNPDMMMCAYNKINSVYCSDNKQLLTDILREEWGYEGMVITDWGAMHDKVAAFKAGCDLSMPGKTKHLQKHPLQAYQNGKLKKEEIDRCADRIITKALASSKVRQGKKDYDKEVHHRIALKAAVQSAVLLKNDGILPLKSDKIALVGNMARNPRYQGSGSSHINPIKLPTLLDAAPTWNYVEGCDCYADTSEELLAQVKEAAKTSEITVVIAGLPDNYESEGFDRSDMKMPEGHIRMIETAAEVNPNTVVVLLCGSPVEMPWMNKVKAVLYMGLPGQAGAEAIYSLLTGTDNPSGKLTETWPVKYEDVPSSSYYGNPHKDAQYREGIYVGYRYYETAGMPVCFPFGYGLSYTQFSYTDLTVSECREKENHRTGREISAVITNTGNKVGSEVVQLYIAPFDSKIYRPVKELKGFVKVNLAPGESKTIKFFIEERSFAIWQDGWKVPEGTYEIQLAASIQDVRLSSKIEVSGEQVKVPQWQKESWYGKPYGQPAKKDFEKMLGYDVKEADTIRKGSFTEESTVLEMAEYSTVLRIVKYFMIKTIAKSNGGKIDYKNNTFRMSVTSSVDCALFGLINNSGGAMPEGVAYGLLEIANGHFMKGIMRMIRR